MVASACHGRLAGEPVMNTSYPLALDEGTAAGQPAVGAGAPTAAPAIPATTAATAATALDATAALASLRQLSHLRFIAIGAQVIAIGASYVTQLALNYPAMIAVVVVLSTLNLLLVRRLYHGAPASHLEVFGHLAVDLAAFTVILLLAGGTGNPFVVLYLLHAALIALLLPRHLVVAGTALILVAFGISAEFAVPLRLTDGTDLPRHVVTVARWVSFTLATAMIAWFVARVNAALHAHQRLLAEAARKALNDEAMLRIGTIAAGAAHELASPLMSMGMIVQEWQREGGAADLPRDARLLASQIAACKEALAHLRNAAHAARLDEGVVQPVDECLRQIAERCRAMRPGVDLRCDFHGPPPAPAIIADPALKQAILILLNNAADASPDYVALSASWDDDQLRLAVVDHGTGIPASCLNRLGRTFFTTKSPGKGTGLGVMLTASTVARLGGIVTWSNRHEGGAVANVRIPLSSLQRNLTGARK